MSDPETLAPSSPLGNFSAMAGLTAVDESGAVPVRLARDITETARALGAIMPRRDLFRMNGQLVYFDWEGERQVMEPAKFRTWVRDEASCLIFEKRDKDTDRPIVETLTKDASETIMKAEAFLRGVRPLSGMDSVRLPVLREGGALELLPDGYDEETGVFTVEGGVKYEMEMDVAAANGNLRRMFGGFPLTDERSWSVMVAGLLALYVRHLPGGGGLRPGILFLGNKPGCGKSVLAKAIQYPVLGRAPTVKMKAGEQLDKEMEAMMLAGKRALFFDNVYGGLSSATLDALLTSEEQEGRAMGGHGTFRAKNSALLIVSGNGLTANEDAVRRFLVVDLFEKGTPGERNVSRGALLNDAVMKRPEWRAQVLAMCHAWVRNWHEKGMPEGTVTFPTFEDFSWLVGGIVEAAGFPNPFIPPEIPDALNPDEQEFCELMEEVLGEMGDKVELDVTLEDLARLARRRKLYEAKVGTEAEGRKRTILDDKLDKQEAPYAVDKGYLTDSQRSGFGKKIKKQAGTEKRVKGRTMEFGRREQSRKSTYTVKILK